MIEKEKGREREGGGMRAKAGLHSRLALFIRAGRSCSAVPENDAPLTFLCNTFIFFYLFFLSHFLLFFIFLSSLSFLSSNEKT